MMIARRTVWIMAVASGVSVANLYYNQPLLARMADDFGVTAQRMGIVSTLGQMGYGLGLLLFVPLGDLFERRRLILIMLAAVTLALLAVAVSPGFSWLAAATFATGAATIVPQLIIPFAASIAEPSERGKVVGTVMSGLLIGILVARTVSGVVGLYLGWRAMYGIAAALMIALMAAIAAWLPKSPLPAVKTSYGALMRSMTGLIRELPEVRQAAILGGLTFAAFSVFWTTLAFHLAQPPFEYGSDVAGMFGLIGAGGALAAPLVGAVADRRSPRWSIGGGLLLSLAAYLVFAASGRTIAGMVAGVVLLDLGIQGCHVANQAKIYGLRPEARSRLNTIYMVAFFFGGSLGSLAGAAAWTRFGWPGVCTVGILFLLVALAVFLIPIQSPHSE